MGEAVERACTLRHTLRQWRAGGGAGRHGRCASFARARCSTASCAPGFQSKCGCVPRRSTRASRRRLASRPGQSEPTPSDVNENNTVIRGRPSRLLINLSRRSKTQRRTLPKCATLSAFPAKPAETTACCRERAGGQALGERPYSISVSRHASRPCVVTASVSLVLYAHANSTCIS